MTEFENRWIVDSFSNIGWAKNWGKEREKIVINFHLRAQPNRFRPKSVHNRKIIES